MSRKRVPEEDDDYISVEQEYYGERMQMYDQHQQQEYDFYHNLMALPIGSTSLNENRGQSQSLECTSDGNNTDSSQHQPGQPLDESQYMDIDRSSPTDSLDYAENDFLNSLPSNHTDDDVDDYGDDAEEEYFPSFDDETEEAYHTLFDQSERRQELSEVEGVLCALMFQIRHKADNAATQDVAEEINSGAYPKVIIKSTLYKSLLKKVPSPFLPAVRKYFYASCGGLVGPVMEHELRKPTQACSNLHPECAIEWPSDQMEDGLYFCSVQLKDWLQHLVPIWYEMLRLKSHKSNPNILHDLPDTEHYKKLVGRSTDDNIETLTITLSWDGVKYFKNDQMWPLFAFLNELPFQHRINNPMLIALQAGSSKPPGDLMLKPVIDELLMFASSPISIQIKGREHLFLVKLLLVIADEPARTVILNCQGHAANFGCPMCNESFHRHPVFGAPVFHTKSVYLTNLFLRKNEEWRETIKEIEEKRNNGVQVEHERGIKGSCQLARLPYVDLVSICPPECMHSMYLGVVKLIIERWFAWDLNKQWYKNIKGKANKEEDYRGNHCIGSTNSTLAKVDERLAKIKFPAKMLRQMPKLNSSGSMKSFDFENLLFYGWPVFEDLIKKESYENFKSLAWILSQLSSREIQKRTAMRHIEGQVNKFLQTFDAIYPIPVLPADTEVEKTVRKEERSKRKQEKLELVRQEAKEAFMWRSNVHHLAHLCDMVKLYGPLPVWSAYPTEDANGVAQKMIKTPLLVDEQVIKKFNARHSILSICSRIAEYASIAYLSRLERYFPLLCPDESQMLQKRSSVKVIIPPNSIPKEFKVGKDLTAVDRDLHMNAIGYSSQIDKQFVSLDKVFWNGQVVCTKSYNTLGEGSRTAAKTINHCLRTKSGKFFLIERILQEKDTMKLWFLAYELTKCENVIADVSETSKKSTNLKFNYIFQSEGISTRLTKTDPSDWSELCTYYDLNDKYYVFILFNRHK